MRRPAPGGSSRRSTTSTRGQPPRSTSGGRRFDHGRPPSRRPLRSSAPASTIANDASGARGALAQHVARVPGRRALFLQRLVGVVDHDGGAQVGNGRERGDPAARRPRTRRAAARAHAAVRCASCSDECNSATRRPSRSRYAARLRARPASATHTIVDPSVAHIAGDLRPPVGKRRRPHHPLPNRLDGFRRDDDGNRSKRLVGRRWGVRRSAGRRRGGRTSATRSTRSARRHRRAAPPRRPRARRAAPPSTRSRRRRRRPSPARGARATARARSHPRARAPRARREPSSRTRVRPQ